MAEKQEEKLFKINFHETRRYEVIVKAPDQKAAERWAFDILDAGEAFRNCRDGYYGELEENTAEYECEECTKEEGFTDHDIRVNKIGDQIDEDYLDEGE